MTQSSRSRKEQSKRFLERQCVASNSLARNPLPNPFCSQQLLHAPNLLSNPACVKNTHTGIPPVSLPPLPPKLQHSKFTQPFPPELPNAKIPANYRSGPPPLIPKASRSKFNTSLVFSYDLKGRNGARNQK